MHRASSASCARLTRNVSHHATLVGEPLQEGLSQLCMAPCGIPETSPPPAERGRVDADGPSESVLRDPCTVAPAFGYERGRGRGPSRWAWQKGNAGMPLRLLRGRAAAVPLRRARHGAISLPGPLLDQIDIYLEVAAVVYSDLATRTP